MLDRTALALIGAGLAALIGATIIAHIVPFERGDDNSGRAYHELLAEDARRHIQHLYGEQH